MKSLSRRVRLVVLLVAGTAASAAVALYGPIAQPPEYHIFADRRSIWGIPNFWDVVSSLSFLIVSLAGILELVRQWPRGALASLRAAYLAFFAGAAIVAVGSAYYHYAPTDLSLAWDRLPMTIVFMAFVAIVVGEHISPAFGRMLLGPLMALGIFSVAYWYVTEASGHGDLRLYIVVQYVPMVLIPIVLLLFPSKLSDVRLIWAVLGVYGTAKLCELADAWVFSFTHMVSGHTLKHLLAAFGIYLFLVAVRLRRPAESGINTPEFEPE